MPETTTLRHRTGLTIDKPQVGDNGSKSSEELIEKLDRFLSSIEARLENFEKFFQFKGEQERSKKEDHEVAVVDAEDDADQEEIEGNLKHTRSRRRSSFMSISNLDNVRQRLKLIKDSMLKTSFSNLENLYKTLDEQYNYLFNNDALSHEGGGAGGGILSTISREVLSQKIITTIQYFDEKMLQIDDFVRSNSPSSKEVLHESFHNRLRYHNFNRALKKAENEYLSYYELPLGWRENKYIVHGYRFSLHHGSVLKSLFHFNHNETWNIWTHIFGLVLMIYITLVQFPSTEIYQKNTFVDNVPIYVFLFAGMACLFNSVIWHCYSCVAHLPTRALCACCDYSGITVLITCSITAVEYVALYNYPIWQKSFMIISALCGLTGFGFNWSPYFDKPECRSLRIGFFVGLAFVGMITFFCSCIFEGFIKSCIYFGPLFYKSFIWYWTGVVFYGGLYPERWRYDIIIEDDMTHAKAHSHLHDAMEVITDNIEKSGEDEIQMIEDDIDKAIEKADHLLSSQEEESELNSIIEKHFPEKPMYTPYAKDFMSLWWVDYIFQSHNIWHICVILGVLGHYSSLLQMYGVLNN
ncbi:uncharacterized protein KQ657_002297 [Scheffersomyces spartinae]|uniref:ADIPOR-like receptor IZH3 n=1 Tax=Scheffersomyces spartinae TaxID=45513 RepID=A0A9P7VES3_9ASCO|nr:uncharacterized protein KQ657_002297 [Scheffersomyces spartinae]KAG7195911.1 hypothetical protein KQ657_002297 [Scheffersomyces spartinae]